MGLNGFHPVDLVGAVGDYPDVIDYCESRGATVTNSSRFSKQIQFPGCKPSTLGRIFFPDEDAVLLFSVVFGHLVVGSHVKQINDLIERERFSQ